VVGETGQMQGWPEAIPRAAKMVANGGGVQSVDPRTELADGGDYIGYAFRGSLNFWRVGL
jgi:hypothetical protein